MVGWCIQQKVRDNMAGTEFMFEQTPEQMPFSDYLARYMRADDEFMDGIRRGVADVLAGRVKSWDEIKGGMTWDTCT